MTKQNLFTFAAVLAFVAAPAFAQCKEAAGKEKGACCAGKTEHVKCSDAEKAACTKDKAACDKDKAACCSKDKAACTKDGKEACKTACKTSCDKDGKQACGETNCTGDQVRYKGQGIPRMVYMVGDERLTCPKTSVALAKEKGVEIKYVVDGKVMDDKADALAAHAQQLEKFYDHMLTVNYCVDGKSTGCSQTAAEMAKKCNKVGDEKFDCPHHAAQAAKDKGAKVKYCVGEMDTTSESMAKIQLTVERIKAAIDEIERAGGKQIAANS